MICSISQAVADKRLLGAALGPDLSSWRNWIVILKAAFAEPLSEEERAIFDVLAGGRQPPKERVSELWICAGRRSGKTRIAACISAYLSCFPDNASKLGPGELGFVMTLGPSKDQARLCRDYAGAFFGNSPILKQEVEGETAFEIRLKHNVVLGVHSSNYRTIRGRTLLAAIFDECAFWRSEDSANPDQEVYRATLPALATSGGLLVGISSPYRRMGLMYSKHRDHFGQDGDVLVVQSETEKLNPTIDRRIIARARENDPTSALSEWDAQFRNDLSSFLDDAIIDAAIDRRRPMELPPRAHLHRYYAFTDASAGRRDCFTVAIGHAEGDRTVLDCLRGAKPPFDPQTVATQFSQLARQYGCREIVGDNFAGEWVAGAFRDAGIVYRRSDMNRSQLYLELIPRFTQGCINIPDHPQLLRELRLLERRTSRSGKDSIDHPTNGSDDYSNALAGLSFLCVRSKSRVPTAQVRHARYVPN